MIDTNFSKSDDSKHDDDDESAIHNKVPRYKTCDAKQALMHILGSDSDSADDVEEIERCDRDSDSETMLATDKLGLDDYVVVQLFGEAQSPHYVAQLTSSVSDDLTVRANYLQRQKSKVDGDKPLRFCLPDNAKQNSGP